MDLTREQFNQQVASYWSWVAKRRELGYWNMPGWEEHQNLLASGTSQRSWLDVVKDKLEKRDPAKLHALSLGCGGGYWERLLIEKGICGSADGCDISPGLIELSQKAADDNRLPLQYFVSDLNQPDFPKAKYDIVIAAGILHHIVNLEGLFENIRHTLKEGGKFIVYDYVGPSRFQWSPESIKRCNHWLQQLPRKYRKKRGYPWYYYVGKTCFDWLPFLHTPFMEKVSKQYLPSRVAVQMARIQRARLVMDEVIPPTPEQFLVTDPSEAIRSEEILPLIQKSFALDNFIPQGGALTMPLFSRTAANFIGDANGIKLAQEIYADERHLIQTGKLQSPLVAFIATPK